MMDRHSIRARLVAPLCGGAIAIGMTLLARDLLGTRLLAELVVDASTQVLQPKGFHALLSIFGPDGKPLLFLSVLLGELALFLVAWRLSGTLRLAVTGQVILASAVAWAALMLASLALVAFTEAKLGSAGDWLRYGLVGVAACLTYGTFSGLVSESSARAPVEPDARRAFLLRLPVLLLAGGAIGVALRHLSFGSSGAMVDTVGQPTPEVTSNDDFYLVSKNLIDPKISGGKWRLRVGGVTRRMLDLSYPDVLALPAREQYTTLQCISNEVGGPLMSNALWRGVLLRELLQRVEPQPAASHVLFRSEDDYVESLPLDFAMKDGVTLAHTMNGEPLPQKHGFPLRLLAPGRYGMNQPKWVTEIVVVDRDMLGYWGRRGWSPRAPMQTSCRIDVPVADAVIDGPMRIHGVAFSGDRGISRVEVSWDGARTWHNAELKPALSPYTWVLWYYDWTEIGGDGRVTIQARATDGAGELQSAIERPPYPSGATGNPKVSVRVRASI
jgi:DMSO/TMAO reductase YedYZ molybdopterin-dependent catalytic subunit